MALRNRAAARDETIGEPAEREHLEGPSLDRQRTGLSDSFGASLEHCNVHFSQSELAGEPQPNGTGPDYQHIKFVAQDSVLHRTRSSL